ncbi:MAG: hypothetical protein QF609_00530, partial [Gammaproteobacteria bacterium]|nr:hypothetical protein [Gammaproteobacteria bacterium]
QFRNGDDAYPGPQPVHHGDRFSTVRHLLRRVTTCKFPRDVVVREIRDAAAYSLSKRNRSGVLL